MICKISCSFGEIIDKITILKIKKSKAIEKQILNNITNELLLIEKDNKLSNTKDNLFTELFLVNRKLWDLEDNIRNKSSKREFDNEYIEYAEQIHIQNDIRYRLKRQINEKYNSTLKEEKLYKNINNIIVSKQDIHNLELGKKYYTDGNYIDSLLYIEKVLQKYKNYNEINSFYIDLLFSYSNICEIYNKHFPFFDKITHIISNIDNINNITYDQKLFCKKIFTTLCLRLKMYSEAFKHINTINSIKGPNINFDNMSYFNTNDINKSLLLYDGGGLGDKFMFSRFIPELCEKNNKNAIIFLVPHCVLWFYTGIFKTINNLHIVSDKLTHLIPKFDYHCNLMSIMKHLNITYNKIYTSSIYKNIHTNISDICKKILDKIQPNTYILNWKGNPDNLHEKHNRMMKLINAIPLFKLKHINFLVIHKNITTHEYNLLKKYNVNYIGNIIDKQNAFYDTISIIKHSKNIKGVITTDTSLPHLSLSLDICTYVLLTVGCEWRWVSQNKITNWYPKAILLRQKKIGNWENPIQTLINIIKK